jgi:hypothetical protein
MIYIEPFATKVSARTASAPEGPWSDKQDVHDCGLEGDGAFCYAAKQHVQLGDGESLVITYNTNVPFDVLSSRPTMYWPRLVRLEAASID